MADSKLVVQVDQRITVSGEVTSSTSGGTPSKAQPSSTSPPPVAASTAQAAAVSPESTDVDGGEKKTKKRPSGSQRARSAAEKWDQENPEKDPSEAPKYIRKRVKSRRKAKPEAVDTEEATAVQPPRKAKTEAVDAEEANAVQPPSDPNIPQMAAGEAPPVVQGVARGTAELGAEAVSAGTEVAVAAGTEAATAAGGAAASGAGSAAGAAGGAAASAAGAAAGAAGGAAGAAAGGAAGGMGGAAAGFTAGAPLGPPGMLVGALVGYLAGEQAADILGKAFKALADTVTDVDRALLQMSKDAAKYNAEVAQAQAVANLRDLVGQLQRAERLGPQLAEYTDARSQLAQDFHDAMTDIAEPVTELMTLGVELLRDGMDGILVITRLIKEITEWFHTDLGRGVIDGVASSNQILAVLVMMLRHEERKRDEERAKAAESLLSGVRNFLDPEKLLNTFGTPEGSVRPGMGPASNRKK